MVGSGHGSLRWNIQVEYSDVRHNVFGNVLH